GVRGGPLRICGAIHGEQDQAVTRRCHARSLSNHWRMPRRGSSDHRTLIASSCVDRLCIMPSVAECVRYMRRERSCSWRMPRRSERDTAMRIARRQVLRAGAAAVGMGVGGAPLRWADPVAQAASPPAKLTDIEHVIIFIQENRAFDHYFGSYRGVRGYQDPNA